MADLFLDKVMLQDIVQQEVPTTVKQREVVRYLTGHYQISERRACRVADCRRSGLTYASSQDPLICAAAAPPGAGTDAGPLRHRCLHVLMQRDGWEVARSASTACRRRSLALRRKRPWWHATAVHCE